MKTNKLALPSVTVAFSALNEEGNIANCLSAILTQKEDKFKIKSIIIHSDGSTDATVKIVKSFKDSRIILYDHKVRKGKSFRLNEIYKELKADYLVQSDADMVFYHDQVIHEMIQPFLKDPQVMMTGGNIIPVRPTTFTEKAVFTTFNVYQGLRLKLRSGNNMYSATGGILAYRKEFIKKVNVPDTMIGDDVFTYFECLARGYKYRFVKKAIVRYRLPQTISDQIKQNMRNVASRIRHERFFTKELIQQEYAVPFKLKYGLMFRAFISNPIYCLYIYLVNAYSSHLAKQKERGMDNKWEMIKSTKFLT